MEVKHMQKLDGNRSIDLSNIPIYYRGKTPHYDWEKSHGAKCNFKIDNIEGALTIIDHYKKQYKSSYRIYLVVEFNGEKYDITYSALLKCNLSNLIFAHKMPFKYEIGQHISNENEDYIILDREYRDVTDKKGVTTQRWYYIKCNKCGKESWREERRINSNIGCSVCAGIEVLSGYNDIVTVAPWMIKYFPGGEEEAKLYAPCSNKKVTVICPECGRSKKMMLCNIYKRHNIQCVCGDHMSYPNKFLFSFFEQLSANFVIEKTFDWSNNRRYDDYIILSNGETLICENQGGFHYFKSGYRKDITLEDRQRIDQEKYEMAIKNGITYYVQLDCRYSDKDWITNSIEHSILADLFDLSKVDYDKCDLFATKNLAKTVCDYRHNNPDVLDVDIADHFNIGIAATRAYLLKGNKLGWCEYNRQMERCRKGIKSIHKRNDAKPIYCIELNKYYHDAGLFTEVYSKESGQEFKYWAVSDVCRGKKKIYNNLHFSYVSRKEFNRIKSESPEKAVGEFFKIA